MLKKLFALSIVMGLLVAATGCPTKDKDKKTGTKATGGGTGTPGKTDGTEKTDKPADKPVTLTIEEIETVKVPQGGEAPVTIKVKRENIPAELTLKIEGLPEGVTFKQKAEDLKIPEGKDSAEFNIQAAAAAKTGKSELTVSASAPAASGLKSPATRKFTVDVEKKSK